MEKPFVALQLYTIRDFANEDAPGALRKIKEMGYDFVELAGIYGMEFDAMGKLLSEIGLTAASAHVQFAELKENLAATVSAYKGLGCEYIIIPMLDVQYLPGGAEWAQTKEFLEEFCAVCSLANIIPVYHNHAHEFVKLSSGEFKLDAFFNELPEMQTQLDTGWVKAAGQNPEAYIEKYAGRCPIIHLKDTVVNSYSGYEDRPVGKGSQNIPATVKAALAAGAKGFVVELDKPVDQTSMEAAQESREYLKSLGY
ncbi:MAG: sugar phosphate isomerase/epimerase [Defluviitaleaceae bacterium]|nr:sugar phosphate isomerase/epimerase [Defluviitaleaceae bacterium]MCL2262958.1 sugar phosphate isomerase/epimerase [Defluviitaleaceae bacterium]